MRSLCGEEITVLTLCQWVASLMKLSPSHQFLSVKADKNNPNCNGK